MKNGRQHLFSDAFTAGSCHHRAMYRDVSALILCGESEPRAIDAKLRIGQSL
ncbi:hypothetical protein [Bradyrhizobium sp. 141]|uniref:hypothetical protein n=1 Tax=Bradyrhizobium sp. 141 TaxID=2782617 RepID=UPI001FF75306|nr:hypothetical protein [Bradyrhizobium sp. 141]MCK1719484.1 hypothetical protein [Bradyrhizobium sp. 141]